MTIIDFKLLVVFSHSYSNIKRKGMANVHRTDRFFSVDGLHTENRF